MYLHFCIAGDATTLGKFWIFVLTLEDFMGLPSVSRRCAGLFAEATHAI